MSGFVSRRQDVPPCFVRWFGLQKILAVLALFLWQDHEVMTFYKFMSEEACPDVFPALAPLFANLGTSVPSVAKFRAAWLWIIGSASVQIGIRNASQRTS